MKRIAVIRVACGLILVPAQPARAQEQVLNVYYAGPDGSVKTALQLAKFNLVETPASADVIVLNGTIPDPQSITAALQTGAGGLLILGPEITPVKAAPLLGFAVQLAHHENAISLEINESAQDGIISDVLWSSAPPCMSSPCC